jgi:hypothetical protein
MSRIVIVILIYNVHKSITKITNSFSHSVYEVAALKALRYSLKEAAALSLQRHHKAVI